MSTSFNPEQFVAANKAIVDSLVAVATTALVSAERLTTLNLNTARSVLEDSAAGASAVLGAKDPQQAIAAQASLAQPAVAKAVDYSRSVYEISAEAQQELTKLVEAQYGEFQKTVAGLLDKASKAAPAGSEAAIAAIQNAIATANNAFGNLNSVAKQFTDAAQANVAAVTKATTAAAKKATKK